MAKSLKEQKSPKVSFKLSKKMSLYAFIFLLVAGAIYFGGRHFFAASVNNQLVSRLSVIKELEKQGGKKALDTIILKTLINQEAKKRKIVVSEKEVDAEISKIEKNIVLQGTTLDSLLEQQGMTKNDLTDEIKFQLSVTKMVDNNIFVSNKEIDDYLASQEEQISLTGEEEPTGLTRDQAKEAIKQQKVQAKIQTFVADLKAKAKINYFIKY